MPSMNQRIKVEVDRLLEVAGSNRPVAIHELIHARHIRLVLQPLDSADDLSGFYHREGDVETIGVNSSHPVVRQRFTMAHELGHALLHRREGLHLDQSFTVKLRDSRSSLAVDPEEIAANRFAAELLMPHDEVVRLVQQGDLDLNDDRSFARAARTFGVSQQALTIRLSTLGIRVDLHSAI